MSVRKRRRPPVQAEPKEPTFAERVADLEAVTNSGVPDSTHKNNVSTNQGDNAWSWRQARSCS